MKQKHEYKFVRLGKGCFKIWKSARKEYQDVIQKYARDGW